ncbi:hypothetical protein TYRP_008988 [Tyrophagus putrescentiae]|nr:hypothetical protein TYRP_008988 [Tyrophagus putrescentiae]
MSSRTAQKKLDDFLAERAIAQDVTYQLQCLRQLYQEVKPGSAQASGLSDQKAKEKLLELKAIMQGNSATNAAPFPTLDTDTVMIRFDSKKAPSFDIAPRRDDDDEYPVGQAFFIDGNPKGELVRISEAIYEMILGAIEEEEKKEKGTSSEEDMC